MDNESENMFRPIQATANNSRSAVAAAAANSAALSGFFIPREMRILQQNARGHISARLGNKRVAQTFNVTANVHISLIQLPLVWLRIAAIITFPQATCALSVARNCVCAMINALAVRFTRGSVKFSYANDRKLLLGSSARVAVLLLEVNSSIWRRTFLPRMILLGLCDSPYFEFRFLT